MTDTEDAAPTPDVSMTTWTVLVRTRDRWDPEDKKPTVLFSYTAPAGDGVEMNRRFVAELRAYADRIENRREFFEIQQGFDADEDEL